MALVEIASQQNGWVADEHGNGLAGRTIVFTSGTVYTSSGGTTPLTPVTTDSRGYIQGYIAEGEYTYTAAGRTFTLHAFKAGSTGRLGTVESDVVSRVAKVSSALADERLISDTGATYSAAFTYSAISANQDGHLVWKNLTINSGFGGQVGQGGLISYFKGVGGTIIHNGVGNLDAFWTSVAHHGPREAGMFIGDLTGDFGGNVYGGHFRVQADHTAPRFLVGHAIEVIPNVAKGATAANTLGTTIAAGVATTSVVLGSSVTLTKGTLLTFTADDATSVFAYVASDMGGASTTVPVQSFSSTSQITAASVVTVGVASTYYGLLIEHNGSQNATAAIQISAPGTAAVPYPVGINFDSSAADATATAMVIGGSWGAGINMNANTITSVGSITSTGSSPDRDVRLVDNLLLDNARYIKFKDSGGTAQKTIGVTSSNNVRFKRVASGSQFEFYDETEASLLARITSSGRADFSTSGITSKHTSGAVQPAFLVNGQVEVWHDTGSGTDYLVANVNGVSKKVALA